MNENSKQSQKWETVCSHQLSRRRIPGRGLYPLDVHTATPSIGVLHDRSPQLRVRESLTLSCVTESRRGLANRRRKAVRTTCIYIAGRHVYALDRNRFRAAFIAERASSSHPFNRAFASQTLGLFLVGKQTVRVGVLAKPMLRRSCVVKLCHTRGRVYARPQNAAGFE